MLGESGKVGAIDCVVVVQSDLRGMVGMVFDTKINAAPSQRLVAQNRTLSHAA